MLPFEMSKIMIAENNGQSKNPPMFEQVLLLENIINLLNLLYKPNFDKSEV